MTVNGLDLEGSFGIGSSEMAGIGREAVEETLERRRILLSDLLKSISFFKKLCEQSPEGIEIVGNILGRAFAEMQWNELSDYLACLKQHPCRDAVG